MGLHRISATILGSAAPVRRPDVGVPHRSSGKGLGTRRRLYAAARSVAHDPAGATGPDVVDPAGAARAGLAAATALAGCLRPT
jgi:hypothetical protein